MIIYFCSEIHATENGVALKDHLDKWGMKVCPIDRSLKIIGQRYTLHLLRNMILLKQKRFNQFLNSIQGINPKTLSIRLHELEEYGVIDRKQIPGKPAHTEYSLTDKGKDMERILSEVVSFSTRHE